MNNVNGSTNNISMNIERAKKNQQTASQSWVNSYRRTFARIRNDPVETPMMHKFYEFLKENEKGIVMASEREGLGKVINQMRDFSGDCRDNVDMAIMRQMSWLKDIMAKK